MCKIQVSELSGETNLNEPSLARGSNPRVALEANFQAPSQTYFCSEKEMSLAAKSFRACSVSRKSNLPTARRTLK